MKSTEKLIKERVKALEEENKYLDNELNNMTDYVKELLKRIQIKDAWADLLIGIGYDYDGYNKVESLKILIDELVDYAYKIKENDETTIIYENNGKTYNILDEEIKGEDK